MKESGSGLPAQGDVCPFETVAHLRDVVLCDDPASRKAHQSLFALPDNVYILAPRGCDASPSFVGFLSELVRAKTSISPPASDGDSPTVRVQLVLTWDNLLRVLNWSDSLPTPSEIVLELGKAGLSPGELQQFRNASAADLFPWLFYGSRYDELRRLCHAAKKQTETRLKAYQARFLCHLADRETQILVASSL